MYVLVELVRIRTSPAISRRIITVQLPERTVKLRVCHTFSRTLTSTDRKTMSLGKPNTYV